MIRNLLPSVWRRSEAPLRREEENPFYVLHREMNRMFDDFFRGFDFPSPDDRGFIGGFAPSVDVRKDEKEVLVKAELPGMDEKDVEVVLADGVLTIRGEKKEEKEDKEGGYWRRELRYGSFNRDISLPEGLNMEKVDAKLKNGILTVSIPWLEAPKTKGKKITIKKE